MWRSRCRASSATCCRCRSSCWPRRPILPPLPTNRRSGTSFASMRWPSRPATVATWRPRRCASSAMPRAPTVPTSTASWTAAAGRMAMSSPRPTAAARALPTAAPGGRCKARSCCKACWPTSSWPTRTSTRWSWASRPWTPTSTRWAASAARSSAPRWHATAPAPRRPRSTSVTRPATAWAEASCEPSTSRSRWRPAPACSIPSGMRACSNTATRACARSRST
mmetsp:Transcript_53772/g.126865  ORF Transcript_53772/g.126865 Transcript_53772/m.126865 type:complete len:223 (-) Transcript_53772:409-1077(-)